MSKRTKSTFNKGFVVWLASTYFRRFNPDKDIAEVDIQGHVDGALTCQENLSILEREYPCYQWRPKSDWDSRGPISESGYDQ